MQIYDKKKKKKKRRDLGVERKFPLICPLAKANDASVFVGRVFFILIRNLELQRGVSEKGLDLQTHSLNARCKDRQTGFMDHAMSSGLLG